MRRNAHTFTAGGLHYSTLNSTHACSTPLYEIFRAYCRRASIRRHHTRGHRRCNSRSWDPATCRAQEASWNQEQDRPHQRHELKNSDDHHDVCTDPLMIRQYGRDPSRIKVKGSKKVTPPQMPDEL